MKKVYIAGKFDIIKSKKLSLSERLVNDFRSMLLKDSSLLTYAQDNLKINDKYIYNGPFYCEQASNGDYTSTDCNIVLENEYLAVMNSDIFIAVFGQSFTVGTIVELDWALNNKKEIIILYCEESSNYTIKSEYWFAIANALKKKKDIRIYTYKEKKELNNVLRDVLYG